MLLDTASLPDGATLGADVCVLGAGAAGLTLALEWADAGLDVLLLEAGGWGPTVAGQDAYRGELARTYGGTSLDYLHEGRLRCFGGSTGHWVGWCRPLEDDDFQPRPWVPRSGWPLDPADLAEAYARACEIVEIPPFRGALGVRNGLDLEGVETRMFHFSPPTRFGRTYRPAMLAREDVRLALNTAAVNLSASGRRVTAVEARTAAQRALRVEARAVVLAMGGIENPRLLLSSDRDHPGGLGNANDLVGRCFMDHLHLDRAGRVLLSAPPATGPLAQDAFFLRRDDPAVGGRTEGVLMLPGARRAAERLRSGHVEIRDPGGWLPEDPLDEALIDLLAAGGEAPVRGWLTVTGEPTPRLDSRVTLAGSRDALGMRRVRLDWRPDPEDGRSILATLRAVADALGAAGAGRVQLRLREDAPWSRLRGGNHHMGTTRMSADPRAGVVDADGRVHGLDNLFVAGSSVFPTAGSVNPTLTIVALAVRLAAHLREVLGR